MEASCKGKRVLVVDGVRLLAPRACCDPALVGRGWRAMAEHEVQIPEIAGRVTVAEPRVFRGAQLLLDGEPAPRASGDSFWLPRVDGSHAEARLVTRLTALVPSVQIGRVRYDVGPKLPVILALIAFMPCVLLFVGGLLGGLCACLSLGINNQIARSSWPKALKLVAMLAVTGATFAGFLVAAKALHVSLDD